MWARLHTTGTADSGATATKPPGPLLPVLDPGLLQHCSLCCRLIVKAQAMTRLPLSRRRTIQDADLGLDMMENFVFEYDHWLSGNDGLMTLILFTIGIGKRQ